MKNLITKEDIQYKGAHVPAGTKLEGVDNGLAAELVYYGKADEVAEKAREVNHRDPKEVETREEKPASKKDKAKPADA